MLEVEHCYILMITSWDLQKKWFCCLQAAESWGFSGIDNGVQQKCIICKFSTHDFISARLKLYLEPVMENAGLHLLEVVNNLGFGDEDD